jgi:hypothetical protein
LVWPADAVSRILQLELLPSPSSSVFFSQLKEEEEEENDKTKKRVSL